MKTHSNRTNEKCGSNKQRGLLEPPRWMKSTARGWAPIEERGLEVWGTINEGKPSHHGRHHLVGSKRYKANKLSSTNIAFI